MGHRVRGELGLTIHDGCEGPHNGGQLMSAGKPCEGAPPPRSDCSFNPAATEGQWGWGGAALNIYSINQPTESKARYLFWLVPRPGSCGGKDRQQHFLDLKKKKSHKIPIGLFRASKF